ncbi:MAG: DUF177 domain-containing protein [Cytophagia bacterium]|nr:MAG: DUF177 domain-containing protein [Cytophagia bacterium]TAG39593.1 MAG: DUF177 domain-containing protein [Cytophagia bacterium]TAH28836.1 MAG: DUF177 domain-containing protein [Cytophagales bacterium]
MEKINSLRIPITGLKNQSYQYKYRLSDKFFKTYFEDSIPNGTIDIILTLQKSEIMIQTTIELKGVLTLVCDRSLDEFEEELDVVEKMIYKFGEKAEIQDIGLEIIPREAHEINFEEIIYELIGLALPTKKLHPRFRDENTNEDDEQDSFLVYSSDNGKDEDEKEEEIDPRWAALSKLKGNN